MVIAAIELSVVDRITLWVTIIVGLSIGLSVWLIVGFDRIAATRRTLRDRLLDRLPAIVLLVGFMLFMRVAQPLSTELAWLLDVNITGIIYDIEGTFVAWLQSFASPPLTAFLAGMYLFGFAYLLSFPFVAYTAIEDPRPFRETVVAFVVNYLAGLLGYALFVSYGPRNHLPDLVDSLLFTNWPAVFLFTAPVTANSNVFPSLHTSFSVTVALLAWRTRAVFPRWVPVSVFVGASIVVATMYLGIHWAIDVIAGFGIAAIAVRVAARDPLEGRGQWLRSMAVSAGNRIEAALPSRSR